MSEKSVGNDHGGARRQRHDLMIIAIAQAKDRRAFVDLYEHYAPRLKSYLVRLGGGDLAEEMAQEVMLTIWRKAQLFDPTKASASTWIFTIARNCFIDRWRREMRPEFDPADPFLVVEKWPSADDELAARQSENQVRTALTSLPSEQAKVIEMSFFQDKPHSVIAAEMDLPLGTVKSRLRLAFARLRRALKETQ
ncbi:MAG: sigma-70 family RNA polymerase sigma factor [Rhodospirillales bacterium]|nr:sigma-70 family RNA polymerase sigma factor [Rhodospirillales bacterium]